MKKSIQLYVAFVLLIPTLQTLTAQPQTYASWDENGLLLDNGHISRYILFENGSISTLSLRITECAANFISSEHPEPEWLLERSDLYVKSRQHKGHNAPEFRFSLNDEIITGLSAWDIKNISEFTKNEGNGATIFLEGHGLNLQVQYLLYPDLPVIRKRMIIQNTSENKIKIDNLDIEAFNISWDNTHNLVYENYARYKHIGPFVSDWDDPLVAVHSQSGGHGLLLGNEVPGILKRTAACTHRYNVAVGLTHTDQDYPFRIWLDPDEVWESPWTFIIPYQDDNPSEAIQSSLADFVREHMGIRLAELEHKPMFVYNTWNPFRTNINEILIKELADAAAACGIEEFIIDDGWQTNRGDWEIDTAKFPNGLKPVFDYIKSKGMKPGLWIALGMVDEHSKVYQEHPEWCVKDKDGNPTSLHDMSGGRFTTCMTTGWKDYIKNVILNLVKEHGLEYVKLDLAIVTSAYMFDRSISGCYATNHSHKDREESYLEIYRQTWKLFDELHAEAPQLFIDCTFETMGALQMIDYDMCKHAEGNWLSNFEEPAPRGSLRVRQMGWWRTGAIPATALVIGNQTMDDPNWESSMKSLMGTLPIMLGDPRKVRYEEMEKMKAWSLWMKDKQHKYNYMMFRQDIPGFCEPEEGRWDGWARINAESNDGGIIGVFRQGGFQEINSIRVPGLDPDSDYEVKRGPDNHKIGEFSGKELMELGFQHRIIKKYGSDVFSVERK